MAGPGVDISMYLVALFRNEQQFCIFQIFSSLLFQKMVNLAFPNLHFFTILDLKLTCSNPIQH